MCVILDRAKWLYLYNGNNATKEDCIYQAVKELADNGFISDLNHLADMTLEDYIQGALQQWED